MKKHVFAIVLAGGLFFSAVGYLTIAAAAWLPWKQNDRVNEQLIGRWELCAPDGKTAVSPKVRQKIYTKKSYVVLEVDKENSTTYVDFIGVITPEGEDKMTETVIYTDSQIKPMLSRSFQFFYKIEDNHLYLKGISNEFNEIWIKISD
ncbi:MAG: hypothetical protein LBF55_03320 [Prevotellaceae bacterium]|jgi:hypothetical protein|nr:hypothetical protein [Prevotellaceae bacterium]